MPKVNFSADSGIPDEVIGILKDVYLPFIDQVTPTLAEFHATSSKPERRAKQIARLIDELEWEFSVDSYGQGNFELHISARGINFSREIVPDANILIHNLFELSDGLQGRGIAKPVLNASVKLADALKLSQIELGANLDVGGYAWFRKGFFPDDGIKGFNRLINKIEAARGAEVVAELREVTGALSEKQLRQFVLTEEFRKFKDIFLNSSWNGGADLNDPIARTALTESTEAAAKLIARQAVPPITVNEKLADQFIRHQTYLMRYSGSQRNAAIKLLEQSESSLNRVIAKYAEQFEGVSPTSREGQRIIREFTKEVTTVRGLVWDDIASTVDSEFTELALLESSSTAVTIEATLPIVLRVKTPPESLLRLIAQAQPFEGRTLSEWQSRNRDLDISRIVSNAKIGMVNGETPTQIARRVAGTQAAGGRDGVYKRAFRDVEATYLTVTNGISNQVKQEVYKANSDIIKTELYVATLDIRTTFVCGQNDGKTFRLGTGPIPPLHFRCRSLRVPYINPDNFGTRPYKPTFERQLLGEYTESVGLADITSVARLPRGHKTAYNSYARTRTRELVGSVPAGRSFDEWLRVQSVAFQDEYLGIAKARIYREGGFSLDKFVARDGTELNLSQLRERGISLN